MKTKYIFFCAVLCIGCIVHTSSNMYGNEQTDTRDAYELLDIGDFMKAAILTAGYFLSEEDLKTIFSAQYDYLSKHSKQLRQHGFFPNEPENYKELTLSHQLPFFKSFFDGSLTATQLMYFRNTHANNSIAKITSNDFNEMVTLVCEKFQKDYPWVGYLFTPRSLLEKFRPFVVYNQTYN